MELKITKIVFNFLFNNYYLIGIQLICYNIIANVGNHTMTSINIEKIKIKTH